MSALSVLPLLLSPAVAPPASSGGAGAGASFEAALAATAGAALGSGATPAAGMPVPSEEPAICHDPFRLDPTVPQANAYEGVYILFTDKVLPPPPPEDDGPALPSLPAGVGGGLAAPAFTSTPATSFGGTALTPLLLDESGAAETPSVAARQTSPAASFIEPDLAFADIAKAAPLSALPTAPSEGVGSKSAPPQDAPAKSSLPQVPASAVAADRAKLPPVLATLVAGAEILSLTAEVEATEPPPPPVEVAPKPQPQPVERRQRANLKVVDAAFGALPGKLDAGPDALKVSADAAAAFATSERADATAPVEVDIEPVTLSSADAWLPAAETDGPSETTPFGRSDAAPARATSETAAGLAADIARRLETRNTRFEVALNPEGLGQVQVSVEIGRDGALTASLAFERPHAAAELNARSGELRDALQQAGFDLAQENLSFTSGGESFAGRREAQTTFAAARFGDLIGANDADLPPPPSARRQSAYGLDLRV